MKVDVNTIVPPVTILPVIEPKMSSNEVYEASNGNIVIDKTGGVKLTPQGETNLNNNIEEKAEEVEKEVTEQKDNIRGTFVNTLEMQSKKSQIEIYMSVNESSNDNINQDTKTIMENLREVKKQNDMVEQYAKYKENQITLS